MVMRRKSLRVLATPMNGHGHVNAVHGLCDVLRASGHQVLFVLDSDFAGRLEKCGYEERILNRVIIPQLAPYVEDGKELWQSYMEHNGPRLAGKSPLELACQAIPEALRLMFELQNAHADQYRKIIAEYKPDLIVHDSYVNFPPVTTSGIPWVWLYSAAPQLLLMDGRIPPFYSGLAENGDKQVWKCFGEKSLESLRPLIEEIQADHEKNGGQPYGNRVHPLSPFLNVYLTPEVLRYKVMDELPETFMGVNSLIRNLPGQKFELPASLRNKPGKWIFFSMGSFFCSNRPMMIRLLDFLSRIPHRFIVAKGPLEYELPGENMYGEKFLPQTAILPLVDLVITHGGNNTITETFYYGKTMIVMPNLSDQIDNAQRIDELGYGIRLNPFTCTEVELSTAIEQLLANTELTERMEKIGTQIRNSNDKQKIVHFIESKLCQ